MKDIVKNTLKNSSSKEEKAKILLSALDEIGDIQWLEDLYMECSNDKDFDISHLCIICLGHLARIYRTINTKKVVPFLKNIVSQNSDLSGVAKDALDDIETFVR